MQYHFVFALAAFGLASALPQQSGGKVGGAEAAPGQPGGVPMDLAGGFKPDSISMQLSFTGDPSEGLQSGAKVQQADAMKEPKFALGDSSGVNTRAMWVIMMVDTTSQQQRMLHYVKSDFKTSGQQTEIASQKEAKMQYTAPGMLGDQGQGRQYTFLMYQQRGDFPGTGMPQPGQPVVMQDFVKANGLDKAIAGMNVQIDVQSMGNMGSQMSGGQMSGEMQGGQMMGGEMGGQMSGSQPMEGSQLIEGGQTMESGQPMSMPMASGGEIMGGAPTPTPAAPEPAGGAPQQPGQPDMAGGLTNGSMPMGASGAPTPEAASPTTPVPSAAASAPSAAAATGAASSSLHGSGALVLAAAGVYAAALF